MRGIAAVVAAMIALVAVGLQGRADERVTFDATPTEYAWRAVYSYANQWGWDYLVID